MAHHRQMLHMTVDTERTGKSEQITPAAHPQQHLGIPEQLQLLAYLGETTGQRPSMADPTSAAGAAPSPTLRMTSSIS